MELHPVHLTVTDDLARSRLTVFFRLLLAIPHFIVLWLWGIAALVAVIASWVATLVTGRSPDALHGFLAAYLRYWTHVTAYAYLLADPFPAFTSDEAYPVDLAVAPPETQNRWTVLFRIVLAIPAVLVAGILDYLLAILAFIGWFVCLAVARMPEGIRNLGAFCLGFAAQTNAYVYLLTQRYPSFGSEPMGVPKP